MCECLKNISQEDIYEAIKKFHDNEESWCIKHNTRQEYYLQSCDICNDPQWNTYPHNIFFKCPICKKLICDSCQKKVDAEDYQLICNKKCCDNFKTKVIYYDHVHCSNHPDEYNCENCNKIFIGCNDCKDELIEYNDKNVCMDCFEIL